MSAPEQSQGVLLRYAGGEVYAAPEESHGFLALRVAGVRVAVTPMEPCPVWPTTGGFETEGTLTDLVAAEEHHRRMAREAAEHARVALEMERKRIADEAAEHERVALEMERTPKRPTKAKRTGKGRAKR